MLKNNKIHKIAASLMVISAFGAMASCAKNDGKKKEASAKKGPGRTPQSVSTSQITKVNFTPNIIVSGQVQAIQEARIYPTSSGARVIQLLADAGDYVSAGQALARLDSRQVSADSELLAAQVRRAQTSLAEAQVGVNAARETLARGTNGPRESALSIEQAELAYEEANSQYQRALATNQVGALSQEEIDRRRTQMETARARLNSTRGDINALMQTRRQSLSQAQARYEAAQADLRVAIAQQAQSNSRQNGGIITSPVGGIVTARNVSVGEIAGASGTPMFTIVSNGALEVAAEVSEADVARLSEGMRARFRSPDGTFVYGTLRRMPAQIDPVKRTGIARFSLENSPSIKAGVFLNGEATAAPRMVSVIPSSAIIYDRLGSSVFVVRPDNSVTKQIVTLGARQGDVVEMLTGPAAGSWVVTAGASFLAENEKINPFRTPISLPAGANTPAKAAPAPKAIVPAPNNPQPKAAAPATNNPAPANNNKK